MPWHNRKLEKAVQTGMHILRLVLTAHARAHTPTNTHTNIGILSGATEFMHRCELFPGGGRWIADSPTEEDNGATCGKTPASDSNTQVKIQEDTL